MLTNKFKAVCALVMLFGCLSIASAGYDTRCCGKQDPYSKFNTCAIPDYPQQQFLDSSV